jgi:hypothetical protein
VSDTFDKVPLIQRHRRVQKTLNEAGFGMDQVHAITIKAWTVQKETRLRITEISLVATATSSLKLELKFLPKS